MSEPLPKHAIDRLLEIASESEAEPAPPGRATPGAVDLDKYRIVREIGRGGMGVVYEAEDVQLGRRVALKVMPETVGLSHVLRRRFAREAQAAARLSHPNIAAVYEATPDYIAMQFVDGVSLLQLPGREPRRTVRLIRDAALAVAFAHENGIIHRDLKPSNMLVERGEIPQETTWESSRIFLLDFGLAKEASIESSLSGSGNILGTPAYMAPEQAQGRAHEIDARSDVYSLGATLYAALKGEPPFVDNDVLGLLRKVVDEEPRSPRVESDLDAITLKCLAKEPERRYQTARELAGDLQRWLDEEPVLARPPSVRYRVGKFLARRRAIVTTAVAASLVALFVFLPFWLRELGRTAAARDAFGLAQRVEVRLADADLALRTGDIDEANNHLDIGLRECADYLADLETPEGYLLQGRLLRKRGRTEEARVSLTKALELQPGFPAARFELGLVELAELRSLETLASVAGTEDPDETRRIQALRESAVGHMAVVEEHQDEFKQIDVLHGAAEINRLRGNLAAARQSLERLVGQEPMHLEAKRSLALLYNQLGLHDEARRIASNETDIRRGIAAAFRDLRPGPAARASGGAERETYGRVDCLVIPSLDATLLDARRLAFARPSEGMTAASRALTRIVEASKLQLSADNGAALEAWNRAIAAHGEALELGASAVAYNNRGCCWSALERLLIASGRTVEAISAQRNALADFEAAMERAPGCPAALRNRALSRMHQAERLAKLGRYHPATLELDGAVRDASAGLNANADDVACRIDRARARALKAEIDAALGADATESLGWAKLHFVEALRRAPDDPNARMWHGLYELAHGDAAAGVQALDGALRLAEPDWLYRERCQFELAARRRGK